jgi:uncharacterized OsmC-like protein
MDGLRRIDVTISGDAVEAVNGRGARIRIDPDGVDGFTPVELFLAALGSCGAVDVQLLMDKQRDPVRSMRLEVEAEKADQRLHWMRVTYHLDGEHDPRKVQRALEKTGAGLCTVSRTVTWSAPVEHAVAGDEPGPSG